MIRFYLMTIAVFLYISTALVSRAAPLPNIYPAELIKLMRAATAIDPNDRPHPMEFGRAFEGCL